MPRRRMNLLTVMSEKEITSIITEHGPLTGAMLVEKTGIDVLHLWQLCCKNKNMRLETAGNRFLRLDRNVEGYARLSPSIRREFLTYTFIGLHNQAAELKEKVEVFRRETDRISREKRDIAKLSIASTVDIMPEKDVILAKACFLLAGDVVYDMSHAVPRPEKSTGEMVHGSDLDIIVVVEDDLDPEVSRSLDNYIHKRKHLLLVNDREEIDYLIKSMSRVREQLNFDKFSSMVASKILYEGQFLYGNKEVFQEVKKLVAEYGIPDKLGALEKEAIHNRELAEAQLLDIDMETESSEYLNLFFTRAEEDEIY
jgi:CRISPR/Cas system-associated exonuclease Cas4 (RecB family)